eukprot:m.966069 g.966069  ORF g.966069 m.966069 type:complete len:262 (-) comp23912_c0_seq17:2730-3515(-)
MFRGLQSLCRVNFDNVRQRVSAFSATARTCRVQVPVFPAARDVCSNRHITTSHHRRKPESSISCWQCGDEIGLPIPIRCPCSKKVIQPVDPNADAFTIMSMPRSFTVDLKALQESYRTLQRILHPDNFAHSGTDREKMLADDQSSSVNEANQTLKDPLKRGLHMLETQGRAVTEESAVDDMEFLMEIMEVNESIEHLTGSEQHEEMKELMAQIKGASESYIQDAEAAFSAGDLDAAFAAIVRLRYYDNCKRKLHDASPLVR